MEDYHKTFLCTDSCVRGLLAPVRIVWQKPVVGTIKTNWDATIDVLNKQMGVRVLLCDAIGTVVASMCSLVPYITDPTMAKGVALWRAMLFCLNLGVSKLHLEGDSQEIVQALLREGPCWSRYVYLIEESRNSSWGWPKPPPKASHSYFA